MNDRDISKVIHLLEKEVAKWELPIVSSLAEEHSGPFPNPYINNPESENEG